MSWSDRTDVQIRSLGQHVQSNTLRAGRYILRLTNKGTTYATAVWYSTDGGSKWMELSVSVAGVGFKEVVIQNQTRRPILIDDSDIHGDTDMELTIQEIPLNAEPFLGLKEETGQFTPVLEGTTSNPTITYTTQLGYYTRLGNIIQFSLTLVANVVTTAGVGNVRLAGLPYNVANFNVPVEIVYSGINWSTTYDMVNALLIQNSKYMYFKKYVSNSYSLTLAWNPTWIQQGDLITVNGTYRI